MIIEKDLHKLFQQLTHDQVSQIDVNGANVVIRLVESGSKLAFSTPVYYGGNFIPSSVRQCLKQRNPFINSIGTFLTVDEKEYQIFLNYEGPFNLHIDKRLFLGLLEEFQWLADEWRAFLDEHDKNDLIYVRAK